MPQDTVLFNNRLIVSRARMAVNRKTVTKLQKRMCTLYRVCMLLSPVFAIGFYTAQIYPNQVAGLLGIKCGLTTEQDLLSRGDRLTAKISLLSVAAKTVLQLNALDGANVILVQSAIDPMMGHLKFMNTTFEFHAYSLSSNSSGSYSGRDQGGNMTRSNTSDSKGPKPLPSAPPSPSPSPKPPPPSNNTRVGGLSLIPVHDFSKLRYCASSNHSLGSGFCFRLKSVISRTYPFHFFTSYSTEEVTLSNALETRSSIDSAETSLAGELSSLNEELFRFLVVHGRLNPGESDVRQRYRADAVVNWNTLLWTIRNNLESCRSTLWRIFRKHEHLSPYDTWSLQNGRLLSQMWYLSNSTQATKTFLDILACEVLKPMCVIGEKEMLDMYSLYI